MMVETEKLPMVCSCPSCRDAVAAYIPSGSAHAMFLDIDGSAHASTCARRVKVAQLVTTKRKSDP